MNKVTKIDIKNDKNGNPMKVTTFDNNITVFVSSKYDAPIYEKVAVDGEFELTKDGEYTKIKYDKPATNSNYSKTAQIEKSMDRKEAGIEKTLDRKEDSFKTSATFRDATILAVESIKGKPFPNEDDIKNEWLMWRKWLLENYEIMPF